MAHRLAGFAAEGDSLSLVLKGDSAAAPDLPIRPAQLLGLVFALQRGHRWIDPYSVQMRLARRLYAALSRIKSRLRLRLWRGSSPRHPPELLREP